jgi:hypothetical protein
MGRKCPSEPPRASMKWAARRRNAQPIGAGRVYSQTAPLSHAARGCSSLKCGFCKRRQGRISGLGQARAARPSSFKSERDWGRGIFDGVPRSRSRERVRGRLACVNNQVGRSGSGESRRPPYSTQGTLGRKRQCSNRAIAGAALAKRVKPQHGALRSRASAEKRQAGVRDWNRHARCSGGDRERQTPKEDGQGSSNPLGAGGQRSRLHKGGRGNADCTRGSPRERAIFTSAEAGSS